MELDTDTVLHLLRSFENVDNEIRKEAEKCFFEFLMMNPTQVVKILDQIAASSPQDPIAFSAIIRLKTLVEGSISNLSDSGCYQLISNIIDILQRLMIMPEYPKHVRDFMFNVFELVVVYIKGQISIFPSILPFFHSLLTSEYANYAISMFHLLSMLLESSGIEKTILDFIDVHSNNRSMAIASTKFLIYCVYKGFIEPSAASCIPDVLISTNEKDFIELIQATLYVIHSLAEVLRDLAQKVFYILITRVTNPSNSETFRVSCLYYCSTMVVLYDDDYYFLIDAISDIPEFIQIIMGDPSYSDLYEEGIQFIQNVWRTDEQIHRIYQSLSSQNPFIITGFIRAKPSLSNFDELADIMLVPNPIISKNGLVAFEQNIINSRPDEISSIGDSLLETFAETQNLNILSAFSMWADKARVEDMNLVFPKILAIFEGAPTTEVCNVFSIFCRKCTNVSTEWSTHILQTVMSHMKDSVDPLSLLGVVASLAPVSSKEELLSFCDESVSLLSEAAVVEAAPFYSEIGLHVGKPFRTMKTRLFGPLFNEISSSTDKLKASRFKELIMSEDSLNKIKLLLRSLNDLIKVFGPYIEAELDFIKMFSRLWLEYPFDSEARSAARHVLFSLIDYYPNDQDMRALLTENIFKTINGDTSSSGIEDCVIGTVKLHLELDMIGYLPILFDKVSQCQDDDISRVSSKLYDLLADMMNRYPEQVTTKLEFASFSCLLSSKSPAIRCLGVLIGLKVSRELGQDKLLIHDSFIQALGDADESVVQAAAIAISYLDDLSLAPGAFEALKDAIHGLSDVFDGGSLQTYLALALTTVGTNVDTMETLEYVMRLLPVTTPVPEAKSVYKWLINLVDANGKPDELAQELMIAINNGIIDREVLPFNI